MLLVRRLMSSFGILLLTRASLTIDSSFNQGFGMYIAVPPSLKRWRHRAF